MSLIQICEEIILEKKKGRNVKEFLFIKIFFCEFYFSKPSTFKFIKKKIITKAGLS